MLAVLPLTMLLRTVAEPKLLIPAPKPQEVTQLVVLRVLSATRLLMIVNEPLLPMPPPLALPVPVLPTVLPLTSESVRVTIASGAIATAPPSGPNPAIRHRTTRRTRSS